MKEKLKRYTLIFGLLILTGWLVASIRFVMLKQTPIDEIVLKKDTLYIHQDFINDCIRVRDKLFFVSLKKIQQCLSEHPFAKTVAVQRKAPRKLILNIEEYMPIGLLEGNNFPISEGGVIIKQKSDLPLILVSGKKAVENYPNIFRSIKQYPALFKRIKKTEYLGTRRWRLHIDEKGIIDLGENTAVALKQADIELKKQETPFNKNLDLRDSKRIFITK
ncbi:MAG: FtsQ-type POTRA domain-containing protein [Alphaproteobacteria bacterium]|nr:FtsQ-type POTRA domain-containing protein [Alphaproteobacteria bacterium]MBN2779866.1 FtsQ-type POTRA domain-containing protein [Alphaproteobacteria bacterium]